ncbi:hypothetical protein ACFW96_08080 [Streptomyces gardneri]|uniref:hypothetical protein n=1 Tax=Streptomyces gardneri TaxID=66892 RepID=UPI0036A26E04
MRGPALRLATCAVLAGALLSVSACGSSVDPIERLGRKAAERMGTPDTTTTAEKAELKEKVDGVSPRRVGRAD